MQIHDIFSSFVAVDYLTLDNRKLELICSKQDNNLNIRPHLDLTDPEISLLVDLVEKKIQLLHNKLGLSNEYTQKVYKAWSNINYPNSATEPHNHPQSFFSAVYYVNCNDDSGSLNLVNVTSQKASIVKQEMIKDQNKYWAEIWSIKPSTGFLVIFPSWLWHFVRNNVLIDGRISIALDTQITRISQK